MTRKYLASQVSPYALQFASLTVAKALAEQAGDQGAGSGPPPGAPPNKTGPPSSYNSPFDLNNICVLTTTQAARFLGVSPDTLKRMRRKGLGPPRTQISERRIGYRLSDLKSWLDQRLETSSPRILSVSA
jgi:predicted DNA-binding transcriptional regulator AlpA